MSSLKTRDLTDFEKSRERALLERVWSPRPGLKGWFSNTLHTTIGKRYIVTAFIFFLLGGIEAALMRLQLAKPENQFIGPDLYNQIFTVHGSTMIFLFAVPIMEGIAIYVVPLMLGTRNVAFPRLNAYGYYTYVIGGLLLYSGFLLNVGPDTGWFAYVPLSGPEFSPGKRVDIWAQMITFTELSGLVAAVVLITTILKQRAAGMSLNRMPLFVWAILVSFFMVIFAMPAVMMASTSIAMDRLISTHFFNPSEGGDALLWQHLFWFFGHPDVYIIFLPATGMVSTIVAAFSRRPIFGYTAMVLSLVSTAFIGFGLWVHHMFATGLPQLGESFFTAASIMIAIPSGIQVFCWIATLWLGRPRFKTALLFACGFIATFVFGGLSGIMLASVPIDLQVHDTYFVVAHFHYVLIGGAVFPLFGAIYYWFPKMTGRMLHEGLGKLNFWLMFIGFNLTFFPMHQLGLYGMPRRVYTYLQETGWGRLNFIATAGAVIMVAAVLVFMTNLIWSRRSGAIARDDPWSSDTLEWATSSPPPNYNYLYLPTVESRHPLWENTPRSVVAGLSHETREVLVTKLMDAEPDHRFELPGDSIWPLGLAISTGVGFIVAIFTPWGVVAGAVLAVITLSAWFLDEGKLRHQPEDQTTLEKAS
jgi:cytochrome c oxidase subunit I+III